MLGIPTVADFDLSALATVLAQFGIWVAAAVANAQPSAIIRDTAVVDGIVETPLQAASTRLLIATPWRPSS